VSAGLAAPGRRLSRVNSAFGGSGIRIRTCPIRRGCPQRIVNRGGALTPEIRRARRGFRGGERDRGGLLGLRCVGVLAEWDEFIVRADPVPKAHDIVRCVPTALFGLRDFPLHLVADPLQVFLLLAGPGCPD